MEAFIEINLKSLIDEKVAKTMSWSHLIQHSPVVTLLRGKLLGCAADKINAQGMKLNNRESMTPISFGKDWLKNRHEKVLKMRLTSGGVLPKFFFR